MTQQCYNQLEFKENAMSQEVKFVERAEVAFPCPYCLEDIKHDADGVAHMDKCERAERLELGR